MSKFKVGDMVMTIQPAKPEYRHLLPIGSVGTVILEHDGAFPDTIARHGPCCGVQFPQFRVVSQCSVAYLIKINPPDRQLTDQTNDELEHIS